MNLPNGYLLQNGKYRLTHVVGQGGFGITYRGVWYTEVRGSLGTVKTEVPICVKEYFFKDYCYREPGSQAVKVHSETGKALFDKFKEKLIKEAKILSEVHHPHIVNVLEVFEENNTAYIAMEYIAGSSLKAILERNGILPEARVLKYVRQIGEALCFVHEKSILHLDIKPSNILIDQKGNAYLIDFGVSKRYDIGEEETSTTMLTLSKGFAAIEQYDSEGISVFSPHPDVYSLGATMYNLLTGTIPTESILRATRPLKKPTDINPAISATTEAVILRAMQVVPEDRFATVAEMLAALDFSGAEPETAPEVPAPSSADASESEEETTLITSQKAERNAEPEPDEVTIVSATPGKKGLLPEKEDTRERKKRKNWVVPAGIIIFVLVGSAVAWLARDGSEANAERLSLPLIAELDSAIQREEVELTRATIIDPSTVRVESLAGSGRTESVDTPPSVVAERERVSSEESSDVDKRADDVEEMYAARLASGKRKMEAGDFTGAKKDLSAARDAKLTEEVVRLLIACDEGAEEKRVADKKAQYEEKMAFGPYKIVRKKSNNRYGAIDARGEERIPCKYLSVGLADNGRAFEREDNLYDIYNSEGALISEGRTYY